MIEPGAVLDDRYRVAEVLARGGMADVFRALDMTLDREVAVKAFRVGATDVRRFYGEARMLAGFDPRNLVRVFDAGEHQGQPYMVLELVPGPTLAHRLREGPLADGEVRRLAIELSAALAYIHAARVVHRDVKPSNILLAPDGRVLLGDFGIALLLDATRLTAVEEILGTAAYLAPEQVGGGDVTAAADVYALGLVLLEALTGSPMFAGTPPEVMAGRLATAPAVPGHLPTPWPELLASMTALDPPARPTAAEVGARLGVSDEAPTVSALRLPTGHHGAQAAGIEPEAAIPAADERTLVAHSTRILEAPPAGEGAAARHRVPWLMGVATVLVSLLVLAVAASNREGSEVDPPPEPTATTSPATSAPSTATTTVAPPSPVPDSPAPTVCAQFEIAKRVLEAEKQRIEEQYREQPETRERLKKQLEKQKAGIEAQKQTVAAC